MARRYGGRHSPGEPEGLGGGKGRAVPPGGGATVRTVDAAGARANLLFVPPVVLVFSSFGGGPFVLATGLVAAGVLTLAAWLLREGLRAEAAFAARAIARRPALPRKMLASALTGLGVGLAASTGDTGIAGSVVYGAIAAGLHVTAFGIDPLRDKRVEGVDPFQQDRVARVVDEAEAYLASMRDRIAALRDRRLDLRVASFQDAARKMIRTVEEDPRDVTAARKFLGVYLMGARDATAKFADLYARTGDAGARADYEALLTDLEENFAAKTDRLLIGNRTEMDIEIKVLRDRLQREGVKPE